MVGQRVGAEEGEFTRETFTFEIHMYTRCGQTEEGK